MGSIVYLSQIQEKIKEVKDNMTDEFKKDKERLEQDKHQLQEQLKQVSANMGLSTALFLVWFLNFLPFFVAFY